MGSGGAVPIINPHKHKLFQHKLFGPHPKPPIVGPQKKNYVPHLLGKNVKKGPHKLFEGILGVKNRVPSGPFSATKCLVYVFFPALIPRSDVGVCKGTVPGASPLPSLNPLRMPKNNAKETYLVPPQRHISVKNM